MKTPTVPCDKCSGSGLMPLPESLAETLALVPRRGGVTAYDLEKQINGVTSNAQNNRLEKLRRSGLVRRERAGKFWRYSLAPKIKSPL